MCESWNSAFQRLVGHQHPGVWTLFKCLRKDATLVSTLIVQESRRMPPRKRQKRVSTCRRASSTCATLAQPARSQSRSCWTVSVTSSDFRLRLKLYYCNNKVMFRNDMADSSQIAQRTKLCLTYMDDNGAVNYQQ